MIFQTQQHPIPECCVNVMVKHPVRLAPWPEIQVCLRMPDCNLRGGHLRTIGFDEPVTAPKIIPIEEREESSSPSRDSRIPSHPEIINAKLKNTRPQLWRDLKVV